MAQECHGVQEKLLQEMATQIQQLLLGISQITEQLATQVTLHSTAMSPIARPDKFNGDPSQTCLLYVSSDLHYKEDYLTK